MDIKIIDEKSGNPFRYFDNERYSPTFPRSYEDIGNVKSVIEQLLTQLNLPQNIECLEIGAGSNQSPSQSLAKLGARVATLDADWTHAHTDISHERLLELEKELGKDVLIPRIAGGRDNVTSHMGDIAFLRDPHSSLKEKEFDFIYFWGSMLSNGICRSIQNSCQALEHEIKIKYADRVLKPIPAVKKGGIMMSVAGYFCGHEEETMKRVGLNNRDLADLGLYWALGSDREARVLGFLTQSPESVMERQRIPFDSETKEILYGNPLERIVQTNGPSLFGKEKDYARLREAQENLGVVNGQRLENLGMIDAVFVGF